MVEEPPVEQRQNRESAQTGESEQADQDPQKAVLAAGGGELAGLGVGQGALQPGHTGGKLLGPSG